MANTVNLESFLDNAEKILGKILNNDNLFFYEKLDVSVEKIKGELNDKFGKLKEEIKVLETNNSLKEIGLSGEQLKFKLNAFYFIRDELIKSKESKSMKKMLQVIGIILGNLGTVSPVAHAIKEIVDSLKPLLDYMWDYIKDITF